MSRSALVLLLLCACIERPQSPRAQAQLIDRSRLGGVVLARAPAVAHPVGAIFNGEIELVGYDVSPEPARRGAPVLVTFYWRALDEVSDDWKVFVHLENAASGMSRIIADHWPAQGRYHTNWWRKGDVVKDEWTFFAPVAVDQVEVWTGFYIGDLRLALSNPGRGSTDGQNRVRVGTIQLR